MKDLTPKDKARELVDKMMYEIMYNCQPTLSEMVAKQCALIAVDELIIQNGELYLIGLDGNHYRKTNSYLFEVKQEIEKL
jgi:site-specific recombinase XerC